MVTIISPARFPAVGYDNGILRITPAADPSGLRLSGALDLSGLAALETALAVTAQSTSSDDSPIYAHLGELDFIDVGGLRVLVTASLGQVIKVIATSIPVRRLLSLTGWDLLTDWDQMPDWVHLPEWGQLPVAPVRGRPDTGQRELASARADVCALDGGG